MYGGNYRLEPKKEQWLKFKLNSFNAPMLSKNHCFHKEKHPFPRKQLLPKLRLDSCCVLSAATNDMGTRNRNKSNCSIPKRAPSAFSRSGHHLVTFSLLDFVALRHGPNWLVWVDTLPLTGVLIHQLEIHLQYPVFGFPLVPIH